MKRSIIIIMSAWLVFMGVDFLFHASLLKSLWEEPVPGIKPLAELARLIPVGYLSFLLLTILITYLFNRLFGNNATPKETLRFGLIFGLLFSTAYLFGLYSFVNIPLKHLIIFSFVYFLEIMAVVWVLYKATGIGNPWKVLLYGFFTFIGFIVAGVIIQILQQNT